MSDTRISHTVEQVIREITESIRQIRDVARSVPPATHEGDNYSFALPERPASPDKQTSRG